MGEFPNKATQFSSDNQPDGKQGRPKGRKNMRTMLMELLASKDQNGEWSNPVAAKLLQLAFNKGDMRALQEIIDRIEGRVPNDINLGGKADNPIVITWRVNGKDYRPTSEPVESVGEPEQV